jgi:MoxR-like ATPase
MNEPRPGPAALPDRRVRRYNSPMTKDQVTAVLRRIPTWPDERQQELAELALEIEAEIADTEYIATSEELSAIDAALADDVADEAEIESAFAAFRRG